MARRKSAARRESDFIDTVIKMSSFGVFAIANTITNSLNDSFIIAIIGFILSIIYLVIRKKNINDKLRKSKINDVDTMSGTQFEYFLKLLYKQQGYKVETTNTTGDFGIVTNIAVIYKCSNNNECYN